MGILRIMEWYFKCANPDSLEKVEKLLKLGNLSWLGEYVDEEEKEKH